MTTTKDHAVLQTTLAKGAHQTMQKARDKRNDHIRAAAAAGMSQRKIAEFVGISHQRVAQIVSLDA
jgi:transposase-like protein